jgi:hypothetical protein
MALASILQDGVTGHCKDELALDDTHTYNPPHRKRRLCSAEVERDLAAHFRSLSEWA